MDTSKNVEETELANYDLLENTSNATGSNAGGARNTASVTKSKDRSYSNADAETYAKAGEATVTLLAQLAANKAIRDAAYANTGCKPPGMFALHKKKTAYDRCLAIAKQDADARLAAANASAERIAAAAANSGTGGGGNAPAPVKKFLGMPQTAGIIVTVVGSLALLVGGFILIKKFAFKPQLGN